MAPFGTKYSTTSLGSVRGQEPVPGPLEPHEWCWGIMQAEVHYHIRGTGDPWNPGDGAYIIDDTTVWKTCECAPMVPPRACESPVWTQMDSVGLTGILHVKWCKVEHKCLDDVNDQYKTCNQAYLEKCKYSSSSAPRKTLKEVKEHIEWWLTICYGEAPPCKTAKV